LVAPAAALMSILVVQLAPAGMLFGADRNVTTEWMFKGGLTETVATGQSEHPKVLKWPNHEVIVGYVGQAELDKRPTEEWLYSFVGRHLEFGSLQEVADALTADLNALLPDFPDVPMVLHLGGFEVDAGRWKPRIFHIRNTLDVEYTVGSRFDCSDEIVRPGYFGSKPGDQIRAEVAWPNYFSFRQGIRLDLFNTVDAALRTATGVLISAGLMPVPTTLRQLVDHVKFQVHGYGAYFAAFYPPVQQFVGGGADVVTAAWPEESATSRSL
jgi:hypothetical protein